MAKAEPIYENRTAEKGVHVPGPVTLVMSQDEARSVYTALCNAAGGPNSLASYTDSAKRALRDAGVSPVVAAVIRSLKFTDDGIYWLKEGARV